MRTLYGEEIFRDQCYPPDGDNCEPARCSIMTGWSSGGPDCFTYPRYCCRKRLSDSVWHGAPDLLGDFRTS